MKSKLRAHLDEIMNRAKVNFENFPWENKQAYALWLKQTYFFVQNSTRIVALTGSRFPQSRNEFHERFINHCNEERGHEKLLIDDIKALQLDPKNLKVFSATKAFYQCQFYWVEHINPISFFGYLLFLEGLAANHGSYLVHRLKNKFGAKPLSFLVVHSEEDEDHLDKALRLVDHVSAEEENFIIENLQISADLYFRFLSDIVQECSEVTGLGQKSA